MTDAPSPGAAPAVSGQDLRRAEQRAQAAANADVGRARSLNADAWRELRGNWMFWLSAGLILLFVVMAIAPGLFTSTDPREVGPVRQTPGGGAIFGRDMQGYDIFSRTIYAGRLSLLVQPARDLQRVAVGPVAQHAPDEAKMRNLAELHACSVSAPVRLSTIRPRAPAPRQSNRSRSKPYRRRQSPVA